MQEKLIDKNIEQFKQYVNNDLRNFRNSLQKILDFSSCLFYAIDFRNIEFFDYLVEKGCDINILHPEHSFTPLVYLMIRSHEVFSIFSDKDSLIHNPMINFFDKMLEHVLEKYASKIIFDKKPESKTHSIPPPINAFQFAIEIKNFFVIQQIIKCDLNFIQFLDQETKEKLNILNKKIEKD